MEDFDDNDYYCVKGYCEIYSENSNWEIFNFITLFIDDDKNEHRPPAPEEGKDDDYRWHNDYHHHGGRH